MITAQLRTNGFAFVAGADMRALLAAFGSDALADWPAFASSWNDLQIDQYMADGGRYRRRRHALFAAPAVGEIQRKPHGPHWQSVDYNPLNGGVERWFEPVTDVIGGGTTMTTILAWCREVFGGLAPWAAAWDVEVHQFRIEARANETAQPTPEGIHRDGVDYVLVLLIQRTNIASGTTTIHRPPKGGPQRDEFSALRTRAENPSPRFGPDGEQLGSFTLTAPFDAALVDDARLWHGVTAVEPVDPSQPAFRDVLVVTFRAVPTTTGSTTG